MASFINKRAKVTSEAVTGDGDLVADVAAGRGRSIAKVKDEDLPDNLRAMKPEARAAEIDKQIAPAQGAEREARGAGRQARQIRRRAHARARRRRRRSIASSRTR